MYQGAFLHYVGWSPGEGKAPGAGYLEGMGMLIGPVGGPNFGPSGSSLGTWNLVRYHRRAVGVEKRCWY